MQVTTSEQRDRLIRAGISLETCDVGRRLGGVDYPGGWQEMKNIRELEWWNREIKTKDGRILQPGVKTEYGWTAEALVRLLPRHFYFPDFMYQYIFRNITCDRNNWWTISYNGVIGSDYEMYKAHGETLVDACVTAIEALTILGYLPYKPHEDDLLKNQTH